MKTAIFNWLDSFITLPVTGLDISDRTIKYLSFRRGKNRRLSVEYFGEAQIPEGIVVKGEIKNEEGLAEALQILQRSGSRKLRSAFFAAALPEEKSFLRLIQIPAIKQEDVANAVRWEIENQVPLPPEEIIYDYEVIESADASPRHFDVQITAFPRGLVESYVAAFKKAGMQLAALELESQSIVRALWTRDASGARIILDVGRTRSSIVVFSGSAILFTSTLEIGGLLFEEHIAKRLGVPPQEAERIKKTDGLNKKARGGHVYQALLPAVGSLAGELSRAIGYYQGHAAHAHGAQKDISEILISGGDGTLTGLGPYLSRTLNIPVAAADPFWAIKDLGAYGIPPMTRTQAMAYTAAIGLALWDKSRPFR